MARTVALHVGLEKTGTTYLQHCLARLRPELARAGVLYPGRSHGHHGPARDALPFDAAVCDDRLPRMAAEGSWTALRDELGRHRGDAIVSSELFAHAEADDARSIIASIPADRVVVIVTTRPLPSALPSLWQEDVRHGLWLRPHDWLDRLVIPAVEEGPGAGRHFRADALAVLQRWTSAGPDALEVVPMERGGPDYLHRFLRAAGVAGPRDDSAARLPQGAVHTADDRLRIELMRSVVEHVPEARDCLLLGAAIRPALRRLMSRQPDDPRPMSLCNDHVAWAEQRDQALAASGFVPTPPTAMPPDLPGDPTWCTEPYDGGPLGPGGFEALERRAARLVRGTAGAWRAAMRLPGAERAVTSALRSARYRP